jgi:hypothetical protein
MIIENGGGAPQAWAKVDVNNRLHTLSVSEGFNIDAALKGVNFNINSGSVSLTSANKSAVFYFKNNEIRKFIIEDIIVITGSSTGGTGDLSIDIIQNPTTGTIIDNEVAASTVANRNFGLTSSTLSADVFRGVEGDTFTNGTMFADTTRGSTGVVEFDADVLVLPRGSSIGVEVTPQPSNTSMSVKVAVVGYLVDTEVTG